MAAIFFHLQLSPLLPFTLVPFLTFQREDLERRVFFYFSLFFFHERLCHYSSRSLGEQATVHIACPLLLAGRSTLHSLTRKRFPFVMTASFKLVGVEVS